MSCIERHWEVSAMSCAPWQKVKNFLMDYETTPRVILRSPWLRIPELSSFCIMSMVTIVYYLIYELNVLNHDTITMWPLVEFRPPMKNFWTCSTAMGTCEPDYDKPNTSAYCNKTGNYPCREFSEYEMTEGVAATSELAVALSETTFREHKCLEKSDSCQGWKTTPSSFRQHYVDDFEGNLLKIRTYIKTPHWATAGSDVQSLLKFKGTGEVKRLVPHGANLTTLVDVPQKNFFNSTYERTCGNNTGGRDTCVGTAFGDYISLGILLEAADVTIDENMRKKGFVLHLVCRYSNLDRDDFWAWPWGFKPKLVYEPEVGRYTATDEFSWTEREPRSGNTRDIVTKAALSIRLVPQGAHGRFDLCTLLSKLVIVASLLSISQWLVNNVLTKIYSQLAPLEHVSILYELTTKKKTKECSHFAENDNATTRNTVLEKLEHGGIMMPPLRNSQEYAAIPQGAVLLGSEEPGGNVNDKSVQLVPSINPANRSLFAGSA
eukprot:TRINITY_DN105870_c0_g1_i1.p1 TRINITY_DN105870_c0_g1~~TRINITY_DN105870_c0_g1_i1.p1  ORF type:complete len:491 (+),score=46.23 TRINITY_DN105870_c0_g1_i1:43-1515(+)